MGAMEEFPSSHAEAIKDLEEMQHLSRLVALYTFGALSDIRSSRRKVMFDALSFKEHEVAFLSLFSDRDRGVLEAALKQRAPNAS